VIASLGGRGMAKLREVEYRGGPVCGLRKVTKDTLHLIRVESFTEIDREFYHIYERKARSGRLWMMYVGIGWRAEEDEG